MRIGKIERGDFSRFPFIGQNAESRPQFVTILKHLILNLVVRFFSVSFSLDKRAVKNFLDYENAAFLNGMPVVDVSRCGVVPLLELFNIKKTETTSNLSLTLPHLGVAQEWENLSGDFDAISPSVATKTNERSATLRRLEREVWNLFETEIPTNIIDVFKVVPKERFPFL